MSELLGILAAVIVAAGAPFYLVDILKGKTKPERMTWFIWTVEGTIAFISQAALHGGWSLVYIGLEAVGNLIVLLLSLKYGTGGWVLLDKIALTVAIVGFAISLLVSAPIIALVGVVLADFSGVVLTLRKTFRAPGSETTITWFFLGTAALLSALAVGTWSLQLLLYPVYMALATYAVIGAQLMGYQARARSKRPV